MVAPKPYKQLNSWKELANALGVSVRTTQKWEAERGMPVKRANGEKGRVYADPEELDRWQAANLHKRRWWDSPALVRGYALLATALLMAAGLAGASRLLGQRKGPPALSHLESNFLVVADSQGREVWRKGFPYWLSRGIYAQQYWDWFGNIDPDRDIEMLFVYHPESRDPGGASLICFGKGGREKWRFSAGRLVSDRNGAYSRDYRIASFLVADVIRNGSLQVLVSSHHLSGHPNQFVLLSNEGRVLGEYWHSGHLPELQVADLDGGGTPAILLAGFNSGYQQATLVVLDPRRVAGASAQPPGDVHQLQGIPPASEKARILFPKTCIDRTLGAFNQATHLIVRDGLIETTVAERKDPANRLIYTFDANLRVANVRFSEEWRAAHRARELERVLDHRLTERETRALATPRMIAALTAPGN